MRQSDTIIAVLGVAVSVLFGTSIADAQQAICGPHEKTAQVLLEGWQEVLVARGISPSGGMLEIYASPKGTWTVVTVMPDGKACVRADGTDWEVLVIPGRDS